MADKETAGVQQEGQHVDTSMLVPATRLALFVDLISVLNDKDELGKAVHQLFNEREEVALELVSALDDYDDGPSDRDVDEVELEELEEDEDDSVIEEIDEDEIDVVQDDESDVMDKDLADRERD